MNTFEPITEVSPLFPSKDTLREAINHGIGKLPITSNNELISVLMVYHNSLLKQVHKPKIVKKRSSLDFAL